MHRLSNIRSLLPRTWGNQLAVISLSRKSWVCVWIGVFDWSFDKTSLENNPAPFYRNQGLLPQRFMLSTGLSGDHCQRQRLRTGLMALSTHKTRHHRQHPADFILLGKGLVINYGEGGGGYKMGKSRVWNFLCPPPPQDRVNLLAPPLLKSGNFLRPPPFNMAKTSSYCIKTPPYTFYAPPPPLSTWLKLFPPPPPFS